MRQMSPHLVFGQEQYTINFFVFAEFIKLLIKSIYEWNLHKL